MPPAHADTGSLDNAVRKLAADHLPHSEQQRRPHPDVVDGIMAAGYASHFVPARYGGAEQPVTPLVDRLIRFGADAISAAWCAMIFATSARMAGYLPPAGQDDIWAAGPDTLIAAALNPSGSARRDGRGWRLTGRWAFMSGVDFAGWALVRVNAETAGDRFFAVPSQDWETHDTWHTSSMRGTGSNSISLDDVYVPDWRSVVSADILDGVTAHSRAPFHHVPLPTIAPPMIAACPVGAAREATEIWASRLSEEDRSDARNQEILARATGEVDTAELLIRASAARIDELAGPGKTALDAAARARCQRDCALAAELLRVACERVFVAAGTRAQAERDPIGRAWRDVHGATSHAVLRQATAFRNFAQTGWS